MDTGMLHMHAADSSRICTWPCKLNLYHAWVVNTTSYKRRLQHSSQRVPAACVFEHLPTCEGHPWEACRATLETEPTLDMHVHEHAQYQNSSCYSYRKGQKVPGLTPETSPACINRSTSHTVGMAFDNMHMLGRSGACCNMLASI